MSIKNIPKGWTLNSFDDLLDYIQPTKYIVKSTEYDDKYKTPVLTAGKSFILGYTNETGGIYNSLPVIIFDDFTTATKFVNFPFKVKSSAMKILAPKNSSSVIKFVFYFMQTLRANAGTHKRYWISEYSKKSIPLPPLPEQHLIVAKIEELFSELDYAVENLKKAKEQLKVYRQAVLKWAFEGKLTEEWREESYKVKGKRNKESQNAKYQCEKEEVRVAAEKEVTYSKRTLLPSDWYFTEISRVSSINPKIPIHLKISDELLISFLPMKLVEELTGKIHLIENRKYGSVKKGYTGFVNGDILFAKVTPCMENGKIAIVDNLTNGIGCGSTEFHVIRCSNKIINRYLFYFLIQEGLRKEAERAMTGAVGLRRVPKQFIENYNIPICEINKQNQIVLEIETRFSMADKMEQSIDHSLQQAEALRQSILKRAFEGKLI
jgi:type I restriction enzyme S subunit